MRRGTSLIRLTIVAGAIGAVSVTLDVRFAFAQGAPKILLDQPLRAVEYQLGRLTDDELTLVERKDTDPRYRPVYMALLTRKGVARQYRDEAVTALVKLDKTSPSRVLLDALTRVPEDDPVTTQKLTEMVLAQAPDALRQQRDAFSKAIDDTSTPASVIRASYGALMLADGKPDAAWTTAASHPGHVARLLDSVQFIPSAGAGADLRTQLFAPVSALAATTSDAATRAQALAALGWTRRDRATFDFLVQALSKGADADSRLAAVHSLQVMPEDTWTPASLEPLAKTIIALVGSTPPDRRTEPAVLEAIQFGDRVAGKLTGDTARSVRRELRGLGARVVRIQTILEQLTFDVKWFAVEAGKPVQIVLLNVDAMPHNLVIGKPGSLQELGATGGAMPMPADPTEKAFVPDSPLVLQSTRLLKEGETEQLPFVAPKEPGEYVFLCTFPGHWVRMYGVMLVVESLDAWDASPTVPTDPVTKQPFPSQRTTK
jgi:azurin